MKMPLMRKEETVGAVVGVGSVPFRWTRIAPGQGEAMNTGNEPRTVTVAAQWMAGRDIRAIELQAADGRPLPDAEPGAHIDLHLPNGLVRQYSLMEPARSPVRYRIGVLRDAASRGGSSYVVDELREGDSITITGPRNHFALDETAGEYVLIAGGIGITPLVAMVRRLIELGRTPTLHYLVRDRDRAAFLDELEDLLPSHALHLHVDADGDVPDLAAITGDPGDGRQVYACGPAGLLDAIREATAAWPGGRVHFEQFNNVAGVEAETAEAICEVELRRSGTRFVLEPGETLLEALERLGAEVPCVCREGVCGTCAVGVIEGEVDHRDAVQDDAEKASNEVMFVCVSRPLGAHLVLDL